MRSVRRIALSLALLSCAVVANGAELRLQGMKAQCGSLARVSFAIVARGPVANVQFELDVEGAELVGVHPTSATPQWITHRSDADGRAFVYMRGGPVEAGVPAGQILLRVPPSPGVPVVLRLSRIHAFGDGFGETAPDAGSAIEVDCVSPPLLFRHLAGSNGGPGSRDGAAGRTLLKDTRSLAIDGEGNIYIADSGNHSIRRVDANGQVITLAGRLGVAGFTDGRASAALFQTPRGIALAPDGSLVVADTGTQTIRRVSRSGEVTTIAGKPGEQGSADGPAGDARFCYPSAVAVASDGSIIVADTGYLHSPIYGLPFCGQTIRKIDTRGQVSTIAGAPGSVGLTDGIGAVARFSYPSGVTIAGDGAIWVADAGFMYGRSYTGRTIRRIGLDGTVATVAGRPDAPYVGGSADGTGREAHFALPTQLALEPSGTFVVADGGSIRRVTAGGVVTTVKGISGATRGVAVANDGSIYASDLNGVVWRVGGSGDPIPVAGAPRRWIDNSLSREPSSFRAPTGVAVDRDGNAILADWDRIVRVTADGRVSVVAPRSGPSPFARLSDVAVGADGTIWATDIDKNCVWKVSPDGTARQIGGASGWFGWADGPPEEAMFFWPRGITIARDGSALVADTNNHVLRRVTSDGVVSTIAGVHGVNGNLNGPTSSALFNHPVGIDCGPEGEIWVTESYGHTVRLVTPEGQVLTIAGGPSVEGDADGIGVEARFGWLGGVSVDARGRAWVADVSGMLRVVERDGTVTTAAGGPDGFAQFDATRYRGVDEGLGSETRFLEPSGIAFASDGRLFVLDSWALSLKVGEPCFEGARCGAPRARAVRR